MPKGIAKDPAKRKLNERQQRFVDIYCTEGAEGANPLTAYLQAGYVAEGGAGIPQKALLTRGYGVLKSPRVKREIEKRRQIKEERKEARDQLSVDSVRHEHWKLIDLALRAGKDVTSGDLSVATQNVIALGKIVGAYVDRTEVDLGRQRVYTEDERVQALAIAKAVLMMEDQGQEHLVIEGQAEVPEAAPRPVQAQARASVTMLTGQAQVEPELKQEVAKPDPIPAPAPPQASPCPEQAPPNNTQAQETSPNVAQSVQERPPFTPKGAGGLGDISTTDV